MKNRSLLEFVSPERSILRYMIGTAALYPHPLYPVDTGQKDKSVGYFERIDTQQAQVRIVHQKCRTGL